MKSDFNRGGLVAALVALAVVVAVLVDSIFRKGGGAEGAIVTHLKELESRGFEVALDGGVLVSEKLSFQRISVALDADGQGALVTSTLDFVGRFQHPLPASPTKVSSLGLERARFELQNGEWTPVLAARDVPRLASIVSALEFRRGQLERGTLGDGGTAFPDVVAPRSFRSEAWFIRSEREVVEVAEDWRLLGQTLERPIDERKTTRLTLQEEPAGLFSFPGGIM